MKTISSGIDVLDEDGKPTGEVLSRQQVHAWGKLHRAVHLYVFTPDNQLLLQRRSPHVDHYPDTLSISVTCHVDAGENSRQAVHRELKEELGLAVQADQIAFLFSYRQEVNLSPDYIDRQFNDVYACWLDIEIAAIRFDTQEVRELKLVSFATFMRMVRERSGELPPGCTKRSVLNL